MGGTFDDTEAPRVQSSTAYGPHLVVLLECDHLLAGSARYSLAGIDRVVVGRGDARRAKRSNDGRVQTLHVQIPGRSLSASHTRFLRMADTWATEDLCSKNGTFVNGERVERAALRPGDICELGHTFMRVTSSALAPAEGAPDSDCCGSAQDVTMTLDPELAHQFESLAKIAPSDVPVLLLGESGTGKELVARWVHARTGRRGDFIAVNCGAISPSLVESTLFGHVKGAFSGAVRDEPGFIRAAHGGTLFLDEIGDLPKVSQASLLRVLQEREVVPVGATRRIPVDVRVITATHQGLKELVEHGEFRHDLFARISGFTVRLPSLRERLDDFGILVAAILRKLAPERGPEVTLASDVGRALLDYGWPFNIRELEHCLAACLRLAPDGRVERSHLPPHVTAALKRCPPSARQGVLKTRDEQLRLELLAQLALHAGNLADVARAMGKARMQVHRWCHRLGVNPNVYRK